MRTHLLINATALAFCFASLQAQELVAPFDESEHEQLKHRALMRNVAAVDSRPAQIDAQYYDIDIAVSGSPAYVRGHVRLVGIVVAASLDSLAIDLSSVHAIDSVIVNGIRAPRITRVADVAHIVLPQTFNIRESLTAVVWYRGMPPTGSGLGSFDTRTLSDGSLWYSSLSEPYGGRLWWPSIDHPSDKADSVDVAITCPQALTAVSQGLLVSNTLNGDGSRTFRWRHRYPIATYLVSVTIAKFDSFTHWYKYSATDSLPIVNYVTLNLPPGSVARANAALTPDMLTIFEELFGPYPFRTEKYGHAEFSWGGGMEHQTLTSLGTSAWNEKTIAHELAHQWFGDLITCRTWPDLWLNEGFAQYFDAVYLERAYPNGRQRLDSAMLARAASARSAIGTLYVQDTANVSNLFAYSRVYQKGSWVHHMLRHVLGDSVYFAAIKAYATNPQLMYKTASTADFRTVCETVSGRYLGWFFNQWIFGEKYPQYTYSWQTTPVGGGTQTNVRIRQTTGTTNPSYFLMPIDLRLTAPGFDTVVVVTNNSADQTFQIFTEFQPTSVQFDPGNWILKTAQFVTSAEMDGLLPDRFSLNQNYPNPFNPATVISYQVSETSEVQLQVYDQLGRRVAGLVNEVQPAGVYDVTWNAGGNSSGVYFCRMTTPFGAKTITMMLLK